MTNFQSHPNEIMSRPNNNPVKRHLISIVTPAFNEVENLPKLHDRLKQVLKIIDVDWQWIVVDDHSEDETFSVLQSLAQKDARLHGIRFSRNFGSLTAITCGLYQARGDCAIVLAADLQDPPEILPDLLSEWHRGAQVVWAARAHREGEKASTIVFSRLFHFIVRRVVGIKEMPATGADFFLMDRLVIDAFRQFSESNINILNLIAWMGFRQATITYNRRVRVYGRSAWSFGQKFKLVLDSIMAFSYLPLRLMSYAGLVIALLGFVYAIVILVTALKGNAIEGWSSLMVVILLFSGTQMLMMGVLGEYLWRTLSEARKRPRFTIEAVTGHNKQQYAADDSYPSGEMTIGE